MAKAAILPKMKRSTRARTRWFCANGAVRERADGVFEVTVGGALVGTYTRREPERRNLLIVALAENTGIEMGALAHAFRLTTETIRVVRQIAREQGVEALFVRKRRGRKPLSRSVRRKIEQLFEQGLSIDQAHKQLKKQTSRASIGRVHKAWEAQRAKAAAEAKKEPEQTSLPFAVERAAEDGYVVVSSRPRSRSVMPKTYVTPITYTRALGLDEAIELGGRYVQHVGTWLMFGMLHGTGVYDDAEKHRAGDVEADELRIALDAVVAALTLGQKCVEGVRRLETPSASTLLRTAHAPSAEWARQRLRHYARKGAVLFHLQRARWLAQTLQLEQGNRAVFYIDNHLRPYTGKHTIRKGWRMQDKRVLPGVTDYYVHDASGDPVMRMDVPSNDPLTAVLSPIAGFLQRQVGPRRRVLVVFDRAGAFPEQMAELRDEKFEFVTYERKPYPLLAETEFQYTLKYRDEQIGWVEPRRKNLRGGRGRVRRIALRMPDGMQVNVLAVSTAPAKWLVRKLLLRWSSQENPIKHGVERWGINQLDGRKVESYPEDAVIPNPARRRLDLDLTEARADEGEALRQLARLRNDDRRRHRFEDLVNRALRRQQELEALRLRVPHHARVRDTELTGKLRFHPGQHKLVVDTLRVALANAESELASQLAPALRKPREAKKTIANLLSAPGLVRIGTRSVTVVLEPAASKHEHAAFNSLLRRVNARRLTLPGDSTRRSLRFRIADP